MASEDDDSRVRTAERIAAVRRRFAATLGERLATLAALAIKAGSGGETAAKAFDGLRLGLHNLSGSAPTIGFRGLGARAGELEVETVGRRRPDGGLLRADAEMLAERIAALASDLD